MHRSNDYLSSKTSYSTRQNLQKSQIAQYSTTARTTSVVQSKENDKLLDEIEHLFKEDEKTDVPVSEKLANIANKRWLHKFGYDQLKEKLETYHRPANCEKLAVTQVNPEIWGKLDRFARANFTAFKNKVQRAATLKYCGNQRCHFSQEKKRQNTQTTK